jgi:hypothetical protein
MELPEKCWITRDSKVIPLKDMTDKHLENSIEWCDIRARTLRAVPHDPRTYQFIYSTLVNLGVQRADLLGELKSRSDGTWLTITAESDITIGGMKFHAGRPVRHFLEKRFFTPA